MACIVDGMCGPCIAMRDFNIVFAITNWVNDVEVSEHEMEDCLEWIEQYYSKNPYGISIHRLARA